MLANHKDGYFYKRGVKVEVNRGQLARSQKELADRWKWSRGKVDRFLIELKAEQQIVQQKSKVVTLITIINYDKFNNNNTTSDTTDSTTDEQQTVQQTDTYKNDKALESIKKNDKEIKTRDDFFYFKMLKLKNTSEWMDIIDRTERKGLTVRVKYKGEVKEESILRAFFDYYDWK